MTSDRHHDDCRWMRAALHHAGRHEGLTAPNPSVGCVIIKDGRPVGCATTARTGRPHAETIALQQAAQLARGATLYVTLEPCSHEGKTPPCVEEIIKAGISRVVIACIDPDPRVAGSGIARLRKAGIEVTEAVLRPEAEGLMAGYLKNRHETMPLVTVKLATSMDGRIALADGRAQWITGIAARRTVQLLRARHDIILTGRGTVDADDPMLTCRLPGLEADQPRRVVLTSRPWTGKTADGMPLRLCQNTDIAPLEVFGPASVFAEAAPAPNGTRYNVVSECDASGRPEPSAVLRQLAMAGANTVLVEAGGKLVGSLLAGGLVSHLIWHRSPLIIGADGLASVASLRLSSLAEAAGFKLVSSRQLGDDREDFLVCKRMTG